MIKSKNLSQHITPYQGGTTKAFIVAKQRRGTRPRDIYHWQVCPFTGLLILLFLHQRLLPC
jgi:hypothetical protein